MEFFMALSAAQVWRDYVSDGIPSSGTHKVQKSDARSWGAWLEGIISAFLGNGGLIYTSLASLNADLAHGANSSAWVIGDATTANNGIYRKLGASGSGSWLRVADLPYSFVKLDDVGAGTPNAVQLTSAIPTSVSALRVANIFEANTGNVTVSENGDSAKALLTSSGNQIAPGGLTAGMMVLYLDNGTTFRLLSDQASAAIVAAAEAAATAASNSAAAAAASAIAAAGVQPFATRALIKAIDTTTRQYAFLSEAGREGIFVWRTGDYSARITADTAEGMFIKANAIAATSGAWVREFDGDAQATWFGVVADDATDNATALNTAIEAIKATGKRSLYLPAGVIRFGSAINFSSSYMAIRGAGIGATTLRRTFASGNAIVCQNPTAPNSIQSIALSDFSIGSTVTVTSGAMIYVNKGDGVWLTNINISGGLWQISLAGCFGVTMDNVQGAFGTGTPTNETAVVITTASAPYGSSYGGNIFINNCQFRASQTTPGAAYGIEIIAADGVFVSNSYFGYFATAAAYLFNTLSGVYLAGIKFSNCWFDHAQGNGVSLEGGVSTNFANIEFIGCSFVGGANAAYSFRAISGNSRDVRIVGCYMSGVNGDNIRIDTSVGNYVIAHNVLNAADMDNTSGGEGIIINSGSDFTITGNVITGNSTTDNGIRLLTGTQATVTGNRIKGCTNGISISATFNYYLITGNSYGAGNTTGIVDSGGANKVVANNL